MNTDNWVMLLFLLIMGLVGTGMWVYFLRQQLEKSMKQTQEVQELLQEKEKTYQQLLFEKLNLETTLTLTQKATLESHTFYQNQLKAEEERQQKVMAELDKKFQFISQQVLQAQMPQFLQMTDERFKQYQLKTNNDFSEKKHEIESVLTPFKILLNQYQEQLKSSEEKQLKQLCEVQSQMLSLANQSQELTKETQRFRQVLHNASARGHWGEETLKRVIETTGMSPHCDFSLQDTNGEKNQRPDLVIRLPENRCIIIDAKVPDLDIVEQIEQVDGDTRLILLNQFVVKVKKMIDDLNSRKYPESYEGSLDYTVLFLPAESLFSLALEADVNLIIEAAKKNVILTSPASLIALLRSVSISWKYYQHSEETRNIIDSSVKLYDSFNTLLGYIESVGKGLTKAGDAYNDFIKSYEKRLRPRGDNLKNLLNQQRQFPELQAVNINIQKNLDEKSEWTEHAL